MLLGFIYFGPQMLNPGPKWVQELHQSGSQTLRCIKNLSEGLAENMPRGPTPRDRDSPDPERNQKFSTFKNSPGGSVLGSPRTYLE